MTGRKTETTKTIGGDRRSSRRYYIDLEVRWKLLRGKVLLDSGIGRTVDFSSGGILVETGRKLPVGRKIHLSVSWPVLLHNAALMQLALEGRIVRSDGARIAVQIVQHEFRTAGVLLAQYATWSGSPRVPLINQAETSSAGIRRLPEYSGAGANRPAREAVGK
jgi:hypothetical protein